MLAMGEWFDEEVPRLLPQEPPAARPAEALDGSGRPSLILSAREIPGSRLPRAIMLHDSFGDAMAPLLAEHFSRIVHARTRQLEMALVRREKPDVVIQEMGEGVLGGGPPD